MGSSSSLKIKKNQQRIFYLQGKECYGISFNILNTLATIKSLNLLFKKDINSANLQIVA